jgi:hypothetical protein
VLKSTCVPSGVASWNVTSSCVPGVRLAELFCVHSNTSSAVVSASSSVVPSSLVCHQMRDRLGVAPSNSDSAPLGVSDEMSVVVEPSRR